MRASVSERHWANHGEGRNVPRDLLMKALKVFVSDAILRSAAGLSGFVAFTSLHLP
jgi:hypothetical protein